MGLLDRVRRGSVAHGAPVPAAIARLAVDARSVLLASHGSEGGAAAADAIVAALAPGAHLHQLLVVPELFRHMSGDGWRINASTEHLFCDYLEDQIERETLDILKGVHAAAAARGIVYSASSCCGDPARCLIETASAANYDLVVMGSPRPKGMPGLRSRMNMDVLMRGLSIPLVIVPHPRATPNGRNGR
jgi:nucleotide-binding universal stress UspA family protein